MLNRLIENNYKEIKNVARKITSVKNYRHSDDLIHESYLIAYGKTPPSDNLEFVKWFSRIMKLVFIGHNSRFNKMLYMKELELCEGYEVNDNEVESNIYLQAEGTNEATIELINEINSSLRSDSLKRYIELMEFKDNLPPWHFEMFYQYFEMGMSTRDIAEGLRDMIPDINYQRVNILVNEIKTQIKEKEWKSLNS